MKVGVRELKNRLSHYLASVKRGEEVVVTDRGKPVARIIGEPAARRSLSEQLAEIERKGIVTLPKQHRSKTAPEPAEVNGKPLSEIVIEDRR